MATAISIFKILQAIELKTAELYRTISIIYRLKNEKVADFFEELCADEELHARQLEMLFNFSLEDETTFEIKELSLPTLQNLLNWIDNKNQAYFKKSETAELTEIFQTAVSLESNLAERHHSGFLKIKNPDVNSLFLNLFQQDNNHLEKIRNFLATLGV